MSQFQSSATLTGALLANKGAAAPSGALSALLKEMPRKPAPRPEPAFCPVPTVKPEPASRKRVKLSFRLDQKRHLQLKLAAAHLRRSSQEILLAALDEYLSRAAPDIMAGECVCLEPDDSAEFGNAR